jgi:DNA-binding GntR family transcriptional regulator
MGATMDLPELDPADSRPKHQQIATRLREMIERGDLAAGERVPGENTLMKHYQVARSTARQALAELIDTGYIRTEPKVGTFVRDDRYLIRRPRRYRRARATGPFASDATAGELDTDIEATTEILPADQDVADRLAIQPDEPVVRTRYRFLANGRPIQSSTSYEPAALTAGTAIERPEDGPYAGAGVISRFDAIGVHITHVSEEVRVRPPRTDEATSLQIHRGVHVFDIRRTYTADDQPVETADITIPGDRYTLDYAFQVPAADEDPATD